MAAPRWRDEPLASERELWQDATVSRAPIVLQRLNMSDTQARTRPEGTSSGESIQRLWRLRKRHHYVDAELRALAGMDDVELRYLFNGERAYNRRWPDRALAVQEAADKRAELEREGWVFHW
jgi:hypothetical protein